MMMDRIIDITEVYPGDHEYRGVCISADWRPTYPAHAWGRAASHIYHMKDLPFAVQRIAAITCMFISGHILVHPCVPSVKWGWGKGWGNDATKSVR
jgi:hypothetical protein